MNSFFNSLGKLVKYLSNSILFSIASIVDVALVAFYAYSTRGLEKPSGFKEVLSFILKGTWSNPLALPAGIFGFVLTWVLLFAAICSFFPVLSGSNSDDSMLSASIKLLVAIAILIASFVLLSGLGGLTFWMLVLAGIVWVVIANLN